MNTSSRYLWAMVFAVIGSVVGVLGIWLEYAFPGILSGIAVGYFEPRVELWHALIASGVLGTIGFLLGHATYPKLKNGD